jgi:hypothetical protein
VAGVAKKKKTMAASVIAFFCDGVTKKKKVMAGTVLVAFFFAFFYGGVVAMKAMATYCRCFLFYV